MPIAGFTTFREFWFAATHPRLFTRPPLELRDLADNPIDQFSLWFEEANRQLFAEFPNAMTLSTVDGAGTPNARIVLLKGHDHSGFTFYTNYESSKGIELLDNPKAALTFYWGAFQRQVRVQGACSKVSDEVSDAYFAKRPRTSQLAAWASLQSQTMEPESALADRMAEFEKQFEGQAVARPPHWGGFCLAPHTIEFWQLRKNRTHDRFVYTATNDRWEKSRLYP